MLEAQKELELCDFKVGLALKAMEELVLKTEEGLVQNAKERLLKINKEPGSSVLVVEHQSENLSHCVFGSPTQVRRTGIQCLDWRMSDRL